MKCKLRLEYKPSNPTLIPRHMNTKYKEELMDYEKEQDEKTRKAGTLYHIILHYVYKRGDIPCYYPPTNPPPLDEQFCSYPQERTRKDT